MVWGVGFGIEFGAQGKNPFFSNKGCGVFGQDEHGYNQGQRIYEGFWAHNFGVVDLGVMGFDRCPRLLQLRCHCLNPKGPGTKIVYTLAPKYPNGDYFKTKVYLFRYMDP